MLREACIASRDPESLPSHKSSVEAHALPQTLERRGCGLKLLQSLQHATQTPLSSELQASVKIGRQRPWRAGRDFRPLSLVPMLGADHSDVMIGLAIALIHCNDM